MSNINVKRDLKYYKPQIFWENAETFGNIRFTYRWSMPRMSDCSYCETWRGLNHGLELLFCIWLPQIFEGISYVSFQLVQSSKPIFFFLLLIHRQFYPVLSLNLSFNQQTPWWHLSSLVLQLLSVQRERFNYQQRAVLWQQRGLPTTLLCNLVCRAETEVAVMLSFLTDSIDLSSGQIYEWHPYRARLQSRD